MANRSSNTTAVPEAKGALDRFKFEVANELGVPLSDGYNGNLTYKAERICRWLYGEENDRSSGASDEPAVPVMQVGSMSVIDC